MTSTEETNGFDINLYPVPSSNNLTVQSDHLRNMDATIRIYDITGKYIQQLISPKNSQGRVYLNIQQQPSGINIIELTFEDQSTYIRVFVKN